MGKLFEAIKSGIAGEKQKEVIPFEDETFQQFVRLYHWEHYTKDQIMATMDIEEEAYDRLYESYLFHSSVMCF